MTSFHLAANLPSANDAIGSAAPLFGGQKEPGQGIFDTVLKNCMDKAGAQSSGTGGLDLFKGVKAEQGAGSANTSLLRPSLSMKGFVERLESLSPVLGTLRVAPDAVPSLQAMLQSLGISSKEASGLIRAASDAQGFVRLDRLLVRLKERAASTDTGAESLVIPPHQVPVVAQMLSAMGMESAQVKELIEKATNGEGGLESQVLLRAVKAHLANAGEAPQAENAAASFSRALGMLCTTTETGLLAKEPQLMALVKGMADGPSTVQQERIKQEIGVLLQEKGIPPEEVKAFLENLTVAQAKDLLKVSQGAWANGPAPEGSANVTQVRVESEKQRAPTADPQKVMDILSKDSADQKDSAAKKAAFASSYSGAKPAGGFGAETDSNAATAKKSDQNSSSVGNASVLETPAPTNGETLSAAAKPGMVGLSGEVPSVAGSKPAPQPPVESSLRAPVVLPEPLPKILDRMVWMVQGGIQRTTVELSPPELGKIQLSLVIENGQIRGVLGTESLVVKELIDANLNQLSSQLESLGFSVQSFQVMVGLNQHQRPDQGSAWQWESPSGGGDPPEEEPGVGTEAAGGGYDGYSGDGQHISVRV